MADRYEILFVSTEVLVGRVPEQVLQFLPTCVQLELEQKQMDQLFVLRELMELLALNLHSDFGAVAELFRLPTVRIPPGQ